MVSLLQTGRFVVVRFIPRYNITELKNQYSFSLFRSAIYVMKTDNAISLFRNGISILKMLPPSDRMRFCNLVRHEKNDTQYPRTDLKPVI